MEPDEFSKCPDEANSSGLDFIRVHRREQVETQGAPTTTCKLAQELSVVGPIVTCQRPFPEELLTGYLDRALTQSEEQRVRLHIEDCESCRQISDEMRTLREAAASTPFATPAGEEWDELPKTPFSFASRRLGWWILSTWAIALLLFVGWQVATSPEAWTEKALIFGSATGFGLLLLSAFLDRRRMLRTDRYTKVRR